MRSQVLLSEVFGYSPEARTRTLQVHIRRLREKLGPDRQHDIETIFGVGYRFQSLSRPPASIWVGLPLTRVQTILVIDDDDSLRDTIGVMLEQEGFRALLEGDGRAGFERRSRPNPTWSWWTCACPA